MEKREEKSWHSSYKDDTKDHTRLQLVTNILSI